MDELSSIEKIRSARKVLNLTRRKFGDLFGVSEWTVWAWETGRRNPSRSVLIILAQKLPEAILGKRS